MSREAGAEPMPVSLRAGMDATRRAARQGAKSGIVEAARQLIRSLRAPQRRVLTDALNAGVDIAVLLSECRQPAARARSKPSGKAVRPACSTKASAEDELSTSGEPAAPVTPTAPPSDSGLPMGRRVEYCFVVDGSPRWFAGQILRDVGGRWADVQFDDGDEKCVKLPPSAEGTVWRWPVRDRSEPAPKRQRQNAAVHTSVHTATPTSRFVGVRWNKGKRKWVAQVQGAISSQQTMHDDEEEAARVFDAEARRLRGDDAHGGKPKGGNNWLRLNFPTDEEVKRAKARGALLTAEDKAEAAAAAERQRPSKFAGVTWLKDCRKWKACIRHDGEVKALGSFVDEEEAARAFDVVARQLRGEDAHGGRVGGNFRFRRLNFPTQEEVARAKARGMPPETAMDAYKEHWRAARGFHPSSRFARSPSASRKGHGHEVNLVSWP